GLLGVGTAQFLRGHFALLGTFILIAAMWIVGVALLADSLLVVVLGWLWFVVGRIVGVAAPAWLAAKRRSEVLGEIWRKLSVRQRRLRQSSKPLVFGGDVKAWRGIESIASATKAGESPPVLLSQESTAAKPYVPASYDDYALPPLELLAEPEYSFTAVQGRVVKAKAAALEKLLAEFSVNAQVVTADTGPVVTMFELELAAGVKVSQIAALANDMARALGAGAVRVVAPMPGKHTIGIEVPNSEKEKVRIKDIMNLAGDRLAGMQIPLFLG
ncbi:unnamed protein product, partial [marine sediment metagenome]